MKLLRDIAFGIAALAFILGAVTVTRARASFLPDLSGENDPLSGILCPTLLQPAVINCDADCREQHNSSVGACNNEGNCICSGPGLPHPTPTLLNCGYNFTLPILPNPIEAPTPICHCFDNSNLVSATFYGRACTADCRCLHGAADGRCDWASRQCVCDYPVGYVWTAPEHYICIAEYLIDTNVTSTGK